MAHKTNFRHLTNNNCYSINFTRPFEGKNFKKDHLNESFNFSYEMAYSSSSHHRNHRTGGTHIRKATEILADAFQGKLAEYAVYQELLDAGFKLDKPDIRTHGAGLWDDTDIEVNSKRINIKSTTFYGNLLLLETKDWNESAEYIPNLMQGTHASYDFFILVRVKPDTANILKSKKIYYTEQLDKRYLGQTLAEQQYEYDIAGYVSSSEVKYIINNNYVLPQNSMLGCKTKMDAENYYIQSGDMFPFPELVNDLSN